MCLLSPYELHNQNLNKIGSTLQTCDKKQQTWISTATLEIGVLISIRNCTTKFWAKLDPHLKHVIWNSRIWFWNLKIVYLVNEAIEEETQSREEHGKNESHRVVLPTRETLVLPQIWLSISHTHGYRIVVTLKEWLGDLMHENQSETPIKIYGAGFGRNLCSRLPPCRSSPTMTASTTLTQAWTEKHTRLDYSNNKAKENYGTVRFIFKNSMESSVTTLQGCLTFLHIQSRVLRILIFEILRFQTNLHKTHQASVSNHSHLADTKGMQHRTTPWVSSSSIISIHHLVHELHCSKYSAQFSFTQRNWIHLHKIGDRARIVLPQITQ